MNFVRTRSAIRREAMNVMGLSWEIQRTKKAGLTHLIHCHVSRSRKLTNDGEGEREGMHYLVRVIRMRFVAIILQEDFE